MFAYLLIATGLITLVFGAECLVRGASRLAGLVRISQLTIGLTVVAFGTSAPELAVSVASSLSGRADIAVGNVVGSNIFNVLLILGLSAIITPLIVDRKLVRFDVPLMIGASLLTWWFCLDGLVDRMEGAILFAGILTFTGRCLIVGRQESRASRQDASTAIEEFDDHASVNRRNRVSGILWQLFLAAGGLTLLVLGAAWLVDGATEVTRRFEVSELVIGLTIVAAGTSLPELATSIVAAMKGERDIAVGNVIGSNLFNLLGVLGLTAIVSPNEIAVANQAVQFDIPIMVAVSVACLPVFMTGYLITRLEGGMFLGYFIAYTIILVLMAANNDGLPSVRKWMFEFVIAVTMITLVFTIFRLWFQKKLTQGGSGITQFTDLEKQKTPKRF